MFRLDRFSNTVVFTFLIYPPPPLHTGRFDSISARMVITLANRLVKW